MRAEKVGEDTTLARIVELVENAGASKAPVAMLADKIAAVFVPAVMGIALVTGVVWLVFGAQFDFALSRAISVLVISCPCALGLATPVAITVATGKCASEGIMIKSAEALQRLSKCDTAVLDKTGTVTEGKPRVTDITAVGVDERELLRIAAALEKSSEHPLAEAVIEAAGNVQLPDVTDFEATPGLGVSAVIEGQRYRGGNAAFMSRCGVDVSQYSEKARRLATEGKTVMYFAADGQLRGMLAAADVVRGTSRQAVADIKSLGLDTVLLTGDNALSAQAVARELNIGGVKAEVLPGDKQSAIADLQKSGRQVVMIGDGINDSPALTCADVGIAVGSATDIAIQSADVVLTAGDLRKAARAVSFSRTTMRVIRQNLFWAFFYNVLGIPIAAGVLYPLWQITLSPMIAAAAMSLSSLFVVTNALRLLKK